MKLKKIIERNITMPKYNVIYNRVPLLFDKEDRLRTTKIESIVEADSMKDAFKIAKRKRFKGFLLVGVQVIKFLIIVLLLSGCVTIRQWYYPEEPKVEYTNPAKFF